MYYLDYAATSPLSSTMQLFLCSMLGKFGNASSNYQIGIENRKIIDDTRNVVREFLNAKQGDIVFTHGGSCGNTLGIKGYIDKHECTVFYSPLLHKSALKCIEANALLPEKLKVDSKGFIDIDDFESRMNSLKYKPFVVVEWASSEIATIQDIKRLSDVVHRYGGTIMVDATGSVSTVRPDVDKYNIDILTFAGHKVGSLKGVGVLYKKSNIELEPLIYGTQENGYIGGTESVLDIASLDLAIQELDYDTVSSHDRDYVWNYIQKNIPESYLIGAPIGDNRLKGNLYVLFKNIEGEVLQILLDSQYNICISTGSACNSGSLIPSATLTAIGMSDVEAHSCIRLTFAHDSHLSKDELDYVCESIRECVETLRNFSK